MDLLKQKKYLIGVAAAVFIVSGIVVSSLGPSEEFKNGLSYRSQLGNCPSRTAGDMAISAVKIFEQTGSLRQVKKKIVEEKWSDKYFVSEYNIKYDPMTMVLSMNLNCPEPLMKVQVYKANGIDSYDAVLVDNGELYDPTYEVLLRQENKLEGDLPYLALPINYMENKVQNDIADLIHEMKTDLRKKLSEVIVNEGKELTIILSLGGRPSSVFLGNEDWKGKMTKLERIVSYLDSKDKIPSVINLTNGKKVVVKFGDKI